MDLNEKLDSVKLLCGDEAPSNEVILVYLQEAETELQAKYCHWDDTKTLPNMYEPLIVKLAMRKIARMGGEGETSHSENGISRQWGSADDKDILSLITPLGRVL